MDSEPHAQAIARGEESINSARPMEKAFEKTREAEDDAVWKEKYEEVNTQYRELLVAYDTLQARVKELESAAAPGHVAASVELQAPRGRNGAAAVGQESLEARSNPGSESKPAAPFVSKWDTFTEGANGHYDFDAIYAAVKERAIKDPGILSLLVSRSELHVKIVRPRIEADGSTLRGALALLISKKFFDSPQNGNTAFNELKRQGRSVAKPNVYRELDKLAELGFVTKEETGYQAVAGMKVHIEEA